MKILVIEDDVNKRRQIVSFLQSDFPQHVLNVAQSYTSGLKALREWSPNLVLLDMSLPNYDGDFTGNDGGKFRSYGGRDLLHQMVRRRSQCRVVVVTQYDTFSSDANATTLDALTLELKNEFPGIFLDTVFYSASQDEWKYGIRRWIEEVIG